LTRLARQIIAVAIFALAAALASPALAHPHVWVTAKAEIVFDDHGEITAIRHVWEFDKDFTAYATLNLDTNNDGNLEAIELKPLADTNIDALKEYDYFTYIYQGNKRIPVVKPTEYRLTIYDGRLLLLYTLPLAKPLKAAGDIMIEVGDPEYFVAIEFEKGDEVKLDGNANGCAANFRPPHALDQRTMMMLGSIPVSQHDLPPELAKAASLLSNVINLRCPKGPGDQPVAADAPADAADAADQMAGQGGGTLSASDRAARIPQAPAVQTPAPQAPPQTAPAAPPPASTPKVVILDQNGQPLPQSPDVQAAAPAPAPSPPPKKSGGLLGWLGGLFSGGH
jgi:ABC-type uncharacterized transport system substrate-binding protein